MRVSTTDTIVSSLAGLDDFQSGVARFVREGEGNGRIAAAAGSGKTHTTVTTISALVALDDVDPRDIIATTFTAKAGRELKERLEKNLGAQAHGLTVGTFHSLALRMLRKENPTRWDMGKCMNISGRNPGIPDVDRLWKDILTWSKGGVPGTGERGLDINLKKEDVTTKDYGLQVGLIRSQGEDCGTVEADRAARKSPLPQFAKAWNMYEAAKRALGAWDFDDALSALLAMLRRGKGPRPAYVFIDEAQDNSWVQLEIGRLLAEKGRFFVIGDGRQAIYSWRGASLDVFLAIGDGEDADIPAETLCIANNYRSGKRIVALGNAIAAGADWAVGEEAQAARSPQGLVTISGSSEAFEEAARVAEEIGDGIAAKTEKPEDFAILCRTNAAAAAFETALLERRIPVARLGATPFFERGAAKDFMAFLLLAEGDNFEALKRIYNFGPHGGKRYLGRAFLDHVQAGMRGGIISGIMSSLPKLSRGSRRGAQDLSRDINRFRGLEWQARVDAIRNHMTPEGDVDAAGGQESSRDLVGVCAAIAKRFTNAVAFVRYADECTQNTRRSDDVLRGRVTVSTVHRSKGLEWNHVYVSATAGVFPHARSNTPDRLEEERRLFYVAVTRARESVAVTYSDRNLRGDAAGPSEFITDYVEAFASQEA